MTKTLRLVGMIIGVMLLLRAVDYLSGNAPTASLYYEDALQMPMFWGAGCLAAGLPLVVATIAGWAHATQWAAIFAGAVYTMLGVQMWDIRMLPIPWPPDDIRLVADHWGHAVICAVIAVSIYVRVGAQARKREIIEERAPALPQGEGYERQ